MPISANQFFTVNPATNFQSKATGTVGGTDYFFFVSDAGDLQVSTLANPIGLILASGVRWVDTITAADRIHVYYSLLNNEVIYQEFRSFSLGNIPPQPTGITGAFTTFSVNFAPNCVPAAYLLLLNDGVNHNLFVARDPAFQMALANKRIYSNILDHTHYVTRPTIAIHPQDTNIVTINVQRIKVSDGSSQVGFYVVQIPGVV